MEQRLLALEMRLHNKDNRAQIRLKNGSFSPQPTSWKHRMVHALLNNDLHSFHSAIAMEEQRPSLKTPT